MGMSQALLPEWDQEMANTRKTLERVPEDKLGWKPHERSWPMSGLATHLANLPSWGVLTLKEDSLDLAPGGKPLPQMEPGKSRKEILEMFDKNVAATRTAIAATSDEQFLKPWTLLRGGKAILTLPKIAVLRSLVMNHNIHHRAQLGVYLRLNDVPVPAIYGPSADEGAF